MSTRAAPRQAPAPARTRPRSRPSSRPAAARPPRARRRARLRMGKWVIPLVALVLGGIVWVNVAKLTVTHQTGAGHREGPRRRGRDRPSQEPVRAAQRHGDRAGREAPRDGVAAELRGDLPGRQDALGDGGRILAPAAPTPPARRRRPLHGPLARPATPLPPAGGRGRRAAGAAGGAGDLAGDRPRGRPLRQGRSAEPLRGRPARPAGQHPGDRRRRPRHRPPGGERHRDALPGHRPQGHRRQARAGHRARPQRARQRPLGARRLRRAGARRAPRRRRPGQEARPAGDRLLRHLAALLPGRLAGGPAAGADRATPTRASRAWSASSTRP